MTQPGVAVVGCVGLPAGYGGFETLAANLVAYHDAHHPDLPMTVYCSGKAFPDRADYYGGARLRYVPLHANGASSIVYDVWSILDAVRRRERVILLLGVSGALVLPLVRLLSRARLVVNLDGLEWKRAKWSRVAASFLRLSEWVAVRAAHVVVADNRAIGDHVNATYRRRSVEIPYGGDHAVALLPARVAAPLIDALAPTGILPYALMLCRIEPENHIHMILEAFALAHGPVLVAVGNWNASGYGRSLRKQYQGVEQIQLLDPVFDADELSALRAGAALYVHGHSAGGTNPALVEMMHFATPVTAFDCAYNRHTTEDAAIYFADVEELAAIVSDLDAHALIAQGCRMREIAQRRYTWDIVGRQYFKVMDAKTD
jgi:glycosyltransferase involved in cell wall biosynthesis